MEKKKQNRYTLAAIILILGTVVVTTVGGMIADAVQARATVKIILGIIASASFITGGVFMYLHTPLDELEWKIRAETYSIGTLIAICIFGTIGTFQMLGFELIRFEGMHVMFVFIIAQTIGSVVSQRKYK